MLTAFKLIALLQGIKNKNAVVCLCEQDREYTPFSSVIDETQSADAEGVIGNVLLVIPSIRKDGL